MLLPWQTFWLPSCRFGSRTGQRLSFGLQQRSKTPSQTYFKHTVYGLRFLLKTEGLSYQHLHLPSIAKDKKLPVILSREEIWGMLTKAQLLKHKILIGLLYGCCHSVCQYFLLPTVPIRRKQLPKVLSNHALRILLSRYF